MSDPEFAGHPPRPRGVSVLPAGQHALLLEVADLDAVLALDAALRAVLDGGEAPWTGVTDVVPAARTVLLHTRPGTDLGALRAAVLDLPRSQPRLALADHPDSVRRGHGSAPSGGVRTVGNSHEVEIAVRYDGSDLADVAALTGLTPAQVVAAHTGTPWRVAFGGFAPGFAYLVGGDPRLVVPRRDHPRPRVAAGSVGLAGEFSGVYPRASPGGWQLLGTTDTVLWDADRDPPALLAPGTLVRFVSEAGLP